jgi:sulfatase modifying factor 1
MDRKHLCRALGLAASWVVLVGAGMASAGINIATVPVGDVGNAADTRVMNDGTSGYGRVDYAYNIGKYEVTAGQYTAFLNAVGGVDTYGLYLWAMFSPVSGSGIGISGGAGTVGNPYTYSVAPDFVNRPVNNLSFWDMCRFANWLNNGQKAGAQDASTTEAGAYSLNGVTNPINSSITRNRGWQWVVTSEDEWYKAAYYKGGGTNAGYWMYPTRSDSEPGADMGDASGNNANFYTGSSAFPIDSGKLTTIAGEFQNSASPYGTFDQGGNIDEWNEAIIGGSYRARRGGDFSGGWSMRADYRGYDIPTDEFDTFGFRVAQVPVPEPGFLSILGLGVVGMLVRRRDAGR